MNFMRNIIPPQPGGGDLRFAIQARAGDDGAALWTGDPPADLNVTMKLYTRRGTDALTATEASGEIDTRENSYILIAIPSSRLSALDDDRYLCQFTFETDGWKIVWTAGYIPIMARPLQ